MTNKNPTVESHIEEAHRSNRIGWLRASVLGANDGIVSTASLIVGIAAAESTKGSILLAGVAALTAGAMSMAAGEYISVSSQADTEDADLKLEKKSLQDNEAYEKEELAQVYEARGLKPALAKEVASQLMEHDALDAHARDELGITEGGKSNPIEAALSSAASFTVGAALPLLTAWLVPQEQLILSVSAASLLFLAVLGAIAAKAGGASVTKGAIRVTFWGALAMALTALVGQLFGVMA
jgi:VIT1/CCC1 family predicted Fe2+/Mn2+ transporter